MCHSAFFECLLAHNDMYVVLFTTLVTLFLICYVQTGRDSWLYASFIAVGMAASSKYTSGSMLLAVLLTYFVLQWRSLKSDWFRIGETLFIGGALTYLGYAFGTPKSIDVGWRNIGRRYLPR
ncbi:MAG: glycosyltransferase family 39 protein [Anaerolineales bacterium]